jgi:cell division protease FtsH
LGTSDTVGLVAVLSVDECGQLLGGASGTSQATQQRVDDEVRRLFDGAHHDVTELLSGHREQLDALTAALLQAETLDGIDAYRPAGLPMQTSATRAA